jgi:hypothetical protein
MTGKERRMTLGPLLTVRVERPKTALAHAMTEMRTWLDSTRLQPVSFKVAITGDAGIALDVTFRSKAEASQFEQAFT